MEQKPSTAKLALKWGVILALATIILSTIINITGLWKSTGASMLAMLPMIVILVLAMKEFKEANGQFMTFGEGLGLGMLTAAVSAVISSIWGILYNKLIDPTFMQQVRDFQIEKMEEQGMNEAQMDQALGMMEKFQHPGITFVLGILFSMLFALVISLIIAAIMKKNKPVF